jgi:transaldolase
MELFLDSVDFEEVKLAAELGFMCGITTTPTFMHRNGITNVDATIAELSKLVPQVHVEALGDTKDEILSEANRLSRIDGLVNPLVFKIPITNEGLKATYHLHKINEKTNVHLIYTLNQAYLAAEAGADYICPLVGRLHDQGYDSFALIEQIVNMIDKQNYSSKVMVSSVRHPEHVRMAVLCGAHAITIPWKVLKILAENFLTEKGIDGFSIHTKLATYTVKQVMRDVNPTINMDAKISDAAILMTKTRLGIVSIVDEDGLLIGIFTDGDLRRSVNHKDLGEIKICELMSRSPKYIYPENPVKDAIEAIRKNQVDSLVVIDAKKHPIGILDVQDLIHEGLID